MTKTISTATLILMFSLCGCQSSKMDSVCFSAKSLAKCCKGISMRANPKTLLLRAEEEVVYPASQRGAPLPVFTWDTKMVLW